MSRKLFYTLLLAGLLVAACGAVTPTGQGAVEPLPTSPPASNEKPPGGEQEPGAVMPFEGFPDEYQDIKIPPELLEMVMAGNAEVLQLPPDIAPLKEELYGVVKDDSYLEQFNFERLAEYADERRFTAVPARSIPDQVEWVDSGVRVGWVYDTSSFYAASETPVYEVYLFNDRVELRDRYGMPKAKFFLGDGFFITDSSATPEVLTFFIKNGCWLCWNAGGRCGCLICF